MGVAVAALRDEHVKAPAATATTYLHGGHTRTATPSLFPVTVSNLNPDHGRNRTMRTNTRTLGRLGVALTTVLALLAFPALAAAAVSETTFVLPRHNLLTVVCPTGSTGNVINRADSAGDADVSNTAVTAGTSYYGPFNSDTKWKIITETGTSAISYTIAVDARFTKAETDVLDGVTAGTVTASKALVVDASKDLATLGAVSGASFTATTSVDSALFTNATLILESLNPATVKLNDTNALQLDNAAISGFAGAADTAGTSVYIESQDGGADSSADGGNAGGLVSVKTGDAGDGGADQAGAAGGQLSLLGGAGSDGGAHTANNPAGGAGGAVVVTAGVGGAAGSGGSGAGGAGGASSVTAGAGGASGAGGTGASGAGGAASLVAGAAGTAAADTPGGAGGAVAVTAGAGAAGGAHTANDPNGGDGGDITLTVGAGGAAGGGGAGVAGDPGKVQVSGGLFHYATAQVIDMADATVTLTLNPGTPVGTLMTSNVLRVDANSGATEDLLLPPEADAAGVVLILVNTGGESIVVKDDAAGAIDTVATAEFGMFFCDGTSWVGQNKS